MQKPLDQYGTESAAKPATAKEGADDDDFDLFGSDVSYILTCIYRYMYSLLLLIPGIFDCILHHFPFIIAICLISIGHRTGVSFLLWLDKRHQLRMSLCL